MAKRGRKPKLQIDANQETSVTKSSEVKTEKIIIRRRGRKLKTEDIVKSEPKKRGRKPKVQDPNAVKPEPKKRGRKPKVKVEGIVDITPKKRGRKPKNVVPSEQEPVIKKRGRKPKDQNVDKNDKSLVFGSKKNVDLGSRVAFEKESDRFQKFGPVQIPRVGGAGNKVIVSEENFSEICRLLRINYGNFACSAHLCQVNISCKNRKINYGDFVDNFNILVNKYGLKDLNGRIVMMYEFDEILYSDGQDHIEIGEGEDPDTAIDEDLKSE